MVISTRYQLYKQYCGQCCRRSLFLLGLDYQTAKKTTLESQEANSSLLCLQVELYTKGNGLYVATDELADELAEVVGRCCTLAVAAAGGDGVVSCCGISGFASVYGVCGNAQSVD